MKKSPTTDHYKVLGLTPRATHADVRKAFRLMTKKYHPDRNNGDAGANERMRMVIEAHKVLSDASRRSAFDRERELQLEIQEKKSKLTPKGRPEGQNPTACSERLLYDLLAGDLSQALKDYEKLHSAADFTLSNYLDAHDWLDCKFLIAEGYEKRSRYDKALVIYEEVYRSCSAQQRAAFFKQEARDRIVRICRKGPSPKSAPQEAIQFYMRALAVDLPKNRKAFFHKKIAECCLTFEDYDSAHRHLKIAFELKPDLKGVTKITSQLNRAGHKAS